MKQDSLEKLLRQKLEGASVPPPPGMWERIEASLAAGESASAARQDSANPKPGTKPARIVPLRRKLWSYGAAACLLLGMIALWRIYDTSPQTGGMTDTEIIALAETPANETAGAGQEISVTTETPSPAAADLTDPKSDRRKASGSNRAALLRTAVSPAISGGETASASTPETSAISLSVERPTAEKGKETSRNHPDKAAGQTDATEQDDRNQHPKAADRNPSTVRSSVPAWYAEAARDKPRKRHSKSSRKISASLFADNLTGSSNTSNQYGGMRAAFSDFSVMESVEAPSMGNILLYRGSEQEIEMRHKTPISFGAGVSFALGKKFALETGLLYTKLHSEMERKGTFSNNIEQNLHYLGIPLSVNYTIAENRYLSFYARAGATAEYCISGKRTRSVGSEQSISRRETTDLDVHGLQTSVGAALGGMFKITPGVGIYVEPGVSHYFENSNQPDSYRTEHPTNFNLRAGLRFSFR